MAITRNNYVFKGHKTLLGSKFVTYGEVELPTRYELYAQSESGFDWGCMGSATKQLAFSMLYQISNEEFAKEHATEFAIDVVKSLNNRDWIVSASEVLQWAEKKDANLNSPYIDRDDKTAQTLIQKKVKKTKHNIVKDVCKELNITQKNLAKILEVPEGTVSSWAVKNEIPRLGKKAIEFYIQNQKNQKIVDSYKVFLGLVKDI
jgi:DNA-binding transcriptional regulator YiaG